MTVRLVLKHPSPVRVLPRRGRVEREGYEILSTPVTIPAGDPPALDQSRRGDPYFPDSGTRIHEGAYWSPLPMTADADPAEVLHALWERRDIDPAKLGRARNALLFTPLRPGGLKDVGDEFDETDLASTDPHLLLNGSAVGEVVREERARSVHALQAWIDANLILAHGRLMLRSPILLQPRVYGSTPMMYPRGEVYRTDRIAITNSQVLGIRPDRALEASDALRLEMDRPKIVETIKSFEALLKAPQTDEDIVLLANRMPALAVEAASQARTQNFRHKRITVEASEKALDVVRPWHLRAALGMIDRGEALDAIRASKAAIEALGDAGSTYAAGLLGTDGVIPYVERWYADRLQAIPSDDVQALASFA